MNYEESVRVRLKSRILIDLETNCWLWQGAISSSGYGELSFEGEVTLAHRCSWIVFRGIIPQDKIVCHTCDVRPCINPDHMFLGTYTENQADSFKKGRAWYSNLSLSKFCRRGHEFTPENTYIRPKGGRMCKTCIQIRIKLNHGS